MCVHWGSCVLGDKLWVIRQPERHVALLGYWSSNLLVQFLKVYSNKNVGYKEYILVIFTISQDFHYTFHLHLLLHNEETGCKSG